MSSQITFSRVTDVDPSRNIVEQVRANVHKGVLSPGDRLPPERDFAEQLGVSRNTVRKAISALVQLGLVTVRKGAAGGAFISQDGGQAIRTAMLDLFHLGSIGSQELMEARKVLSPVVVALACERSTHDDLHALEENVRAAQAAVESGDAVARMALNIDFYRLLAVATKNNVLVLLVDSVSQAILKHVQDSGLVPPEQIMPMRQEIIACLHDRDADRAVATMVRHLDNLDQYYKKVENRPTVAARKSKAKRA